MWVGTTGGWTGSPYSITPTLLFRRSTRPAAPAVLGAPGRRERTVGRWEKRCACGHAMLPHVTLPHWSDSSIIPAYSDIYVSCACGQGLLVTKYEECTDTTIHVTRAPSDSPPDRSLRGQTLACRDRLQPLWLCPLHALPMRSLPVVGPMCVVDTRTREPTQSARRHSRQREHARLVSPRKSTGQTMPSEPCAMLSLE